LRGGLFEAPEAGVIQRGATGSPGHPERMGGLGGGLFEAPEAGVIQRGATGSPGHPERMGGLGGPFEAPHHHSNDRISSLTADRRSESKVTTKQWNWLATIGWSCCKRAKRSAVSRRTRHAVAATTSAERGWPE
jgi:hypothetical protein